MKKITTKARQGDVLILKVEEGGAAMKKGETVTLALGEVTGHAHKIIPKEGAELFFSKSEDGTIIEVRGGAAVLYHGNDSQIARQINDLHVFDHALEDTHAPIVLTPGFYKAWIQREYDPQEYSREVLD